MGWEARYSRAWVVEKTRPCGTAVGGNRASARVEKGSRAGGWAGPRGALICPLIGPCGRVGPAFGRLSWLGLILLLLFVILDHISSSFNLAIKLNPN